MLSSRDERASSCTRGCLLGDPRGAALADLWPAGQATLQAYISGVGCGLADKEAAGAGKPGDEEGRGEEGEEEEVVEEEEEEEEGMEE